MARVMFSVPSNHSFNEYSLAANYEQNTTQAMWDIKKMYEYSSCLEELTPVRQEKAHA